MLKQQIHKPNHWRDGTCRIKRGHEQHFPHHQVQLPATEGSQHEKYPELYLDIQCLYVVIVIYCVVSDSQSEFNTFPAASRCSIRPGWLSLRWLMAIHPLLSPADVQNPPNRLFTADAAMSDSVAALCVHCHAAFKSSKKNLL